VQAGPAELLYVYTWLIAARTPFVLIGPLKVALYSFTGGVDVHAPIAFGFS